MKILSRFFLVSFLFCFFSSLVQNLYAYVLPHWSVSSRLSHGEDRGEIVALQKDEKIIVAATSNYGGQANFVLLRYFPDGRLDVSFGNKGKSVVDFGGRDRVYGLAVEPDDKIVLAGYSENRNKFSVVLARCLPDGKLDNHFGQEGKVIVPFDQPLEIHFLARDRLGRFVVVGFVGKKNQTDFLLGRFLSNGKIDKSFGKEGWARSDFGTGDRLYGVALQRDEKIVVAGAVQNKEGKEACAVARYLSNGEWERLFSVGGQSGVCSSVTLQTDGKILAAGYSLTGKGNTDFFLARLNSSGRPDSTFSSHGFVTTDFLGGIDIIHDLAVEQGGLILVAGEYQSKKGRNSSGFALSRYEPNGKWISSIPFEPYPGPVQAASMKLKNDQAYLVGFANYRMILMRY